MVTLIDTLDLLRRRGVTLSLVATDDGVKLRTEGPAGAIKDDLAAAIRSHRSLLLWAALGERSGHTFAACTTCGEASMVAVDRGTWPRCRMTPTCEGRHIPTGAGRRAIR